MSLLGLVLLVMMTVVAIYMRQDYYKELRITMEQVTQPLSAFASPEPPPKTIHTEKPNGVDREKRKTITMVLYAPQTEEISVLSPSPLLEGEALDEALEQILAQKEPFGTLRGYGLIYYRTGGRQMYKIAITPTSYITNSMLKLILLLALIWLAAMFLLLLVTVQLSKLAVRPMEEAMNREKQFIADASHDLKTPLSVILANNSILRENPQETVDSQRKWIDSTEAAARNMRRLIEEMLTLSDAERVDAPLAMENVDVSSLVTRAVLQMESVAYDRGIRLESEIEEGIVLRTNENYLQRIAASLIENAMKYEPGGGTVRIVLTLSGQQLRFCVQNRNGVISPEDLPHIFERFYRGDKSRQTHGGHGLGLAISKQMTERLGGTIRVDSCKEKGTVFTVMFPLKRLP